MSKVKETMILFGRTIHLSPNNTDLASSHQNHPSTTTSHHLKITTQSNQGESTRTQEVSEHANEEPRTPNLDEETTNLGAPRTLSENSENHETSSISKENSLPDTNDTSTISDETLRKPDELLPCPRCRSMDTKFCYYNNYNVSQPRHFCKKCQRYWTAGGTMRNVPIGSGRRKNKCSPASQYRQIIFSESVQAARAGAANGINQVSGSLLAFGSDSPQYKSMPSAEIHEVKAERYVKNRCSVGNDSRSPNGSQETDDDNSSKSSRSPNNMGLDIGFGSISKNIQEATVQVPCFPVPLWASPWNTAEWRDSTEQPAFGLTGSFYPTQTYWGCPTPKTWNMQCLAPQCELSVTSPCPNSQTLGKRSRDESMISLSNPEKVKQEVSSPKTLRILDQSEAAQSSIWLTLGIESDDTDSVNEARLRKAFRSKGVVNNHMRKASMLLQANPAALHRSFTFQEAV